MSYFTMTLIKDIKSVVCFCLSLSQGVISLEHLGKKGYSIPKAGTIQVVNSFLSCFFHVIPCL